ncbi:MAG: hypothetical protein VX822_01105 [Candidatus Neomarinimicrobiota bacterium]|nr:hypothetical protein [Candidatus Neomarinimicrobiota bacterium]
MSLKAFHLAFISLSTLMAFGFGAWAFAEESGSFTGYGMLSFLSGVALIVYTIKFLRKFRDVSYL